MSSLFRVPLASPARRGVVLAVCCVSVLLVGIEMTAVNHALPSIGRDFHTGASGLSWIIDAYTLVLPTFLMFAASTADRIGRKLVFQVGLGAAVPPTPVSPPPPTSAGPSTSVTAPPSSSSTSSAPPSGPKPRPPPVSRRDQTLTLLRTILLNED